MVCLFYHSLAFLFVLQEFLLRVRTQVSVASGFFCSLDYVNQLFFPSHFYVIFFGYMAKNYLLGQS